jgi:hypothetical protein
MRSKQEQREKHSIIPYKGNSPYIGIKCIAPNAPGVFMWRRLCNTAPKISLAIEAPPHQTPFKARE